LLTILKKIFLNYHQNPVKTGDTIFIVPLDKSIFEEIGSVDYYYNRNQGNKSYCKGVELFQWEQGIGDDLYESMVIKHKYDLEKFFLKFKVTLCWMLKHSIRFKEDTYGICIPITGNIKRFDEMRGIMSAKGNGNYQNRLIKPAIEGLCKIIGLLCPLGLIFSAHKVQYF